MEIGPQICDHRQKKIGVMERLGETGRAVLVTEKVENIHAAEWFVVVINIVEAEISGCRCVRPARQHSLDIIPIT
jgi:hypothetical protein